MRNKTVCMEQLQCRFAMQEVMDYPPYVMAASGSMAIAEGSSPRYMPDTPSAADTCAVPEKPQRLVEQAHRHSKQAQHFQTRNSAVGP